MSEKVKWAVSAGKRELFYSGFGSSFVSSVGDGLGASSGLAGSSGLDCSPAMETI